MCGEAKMFDLYQSNLEAPADDIRFDSYHFPVVDLSGSNLLVTALIFVIRPRWDDAAGDRL